MFAQCIFLFYVLPMWACLGKGEIVGDGGDVYVRYGTVLCSMPYHVYGRRCLASLGGKSKSQDCTWWGEKEGINHPARLRRKLDIQYIVVCSAQDDSSTPENLRCWSRL